jgi:hypothetical protein
MTTNDMVSLRPLVILAIRLMGPGRRRLEMVKLAHDMNDARDEDRPIKGGLQVAVDRRPQAAQPQQRAA